MTKTNKQMDKSSILFMEYFRGSAVGRMLCLAGYEENVDMHTFYALTQVLMEQWCWCWCGNTLRHGGGGGCC